MVVNNRRLTVTGLLASASLLAVGCGSDRAGGVTAPSTITAAAAPAAATNRVVAFDHGNDGDEIDGEAPVTSLVAGTSCPTLSFMIGGFKVSVTAATAFEGGTCANVQPGVRLEVKGIKTGTSVAASKVEIKDLAPTTPPTTPPAPHPIEGEGVVTSVTAGSACPTLQFQIGTFSVKLAATTTFERGTCADVKVGANVEVVGMVDSATNVVTASRVEFRNANAPNQPAEGEGVVTALVAGTACPTLSFKIGTFTVKLDATTVFERGTCAGVQVGVKLEVNGMMDAATSTLTATKVEFKNEIENDEPADGEGVVTSIVTGTACPTLQFMIGTFLVKLDTATVFDKGSCADIKVGMRVHVKGGLNRTTSSVVATRIAVQSESPGHPEAEGESRVTSVMAGSTCPALTFRIDDWTISVDGSTTFNDGACANIAAGRRLHVKGIVTADHTVLATRVDFKND